MLTGGVANDLVKRIVLGQVGLGLCLGRKEFDGT